MAIFHAEPSTPARPRRSLTGTRWLTATPDGPLPDNLSPTVATVLANRGVTTPTAIAEFLTADTALLADPLLLPDMAAAVAAVQDALERGARIRIFGDYDADGITSTALLVRAFQALGGNVDWFVPHRLEDGYGLHRTALDDAQAAGVELGITVDNGITAHDALGYAQHLGLKMIVTDHHEPDGALPPAVAVLNPKRADNQYPCRELAGVGVAFTLLRAVCAARGLPDSAPLRFLDLVAMGTIADVAPLLGENRILVRHGLALIMPQSKKLGLAELLKATGIQQCATCTDVGFQLGPRLNAAGRVASAASAVRLMLTNDRTEAVQLAQELCGHNQARQEEEVRTLEQALAMVDTLDLDQTKALVLASPDWHPGVIGIVASRLLERFHRPTALIAIQGNTGKGSARARTPFHLWEALAECAGMLMRFGGHRVAAGFEVETARIDEFRAALNGIADRVLTPEDFLPSLTLDAWVELGEVTIPFIHEIEGLAPFGMGNPTPVFAAADLMVRQCCRRGAEGNHLYLALSTDPTGPAIGGIWFRHGELADQLRPGDRVDAAFSIAVNTWQGVSSPQLMLKDVMV